MMDFAK